MCWLVSTVLQITKNDFWWASPLPESSAQAIPYRPSTPSHFGHGLCLACHVFSASDTLSLLSCLSFLHPCVVNADTRAAVLLPHLRLLCSQLQFLSFSPRNGAGDLANTLVAFSPPWVLAQSQSFPLLLGNRGPPQCRDRRQESSKGNGISPEEFCLKLWRWRIQFACLPGKLWGHAASQDLPNALKQPNTQPLPLIRLS